jgi:predicted transcriptional regulator
MGTAIDPFKRLRTIAAGYTDEKIVLARKLAREGYTYEQMAPLLGYSTGVSVRNYFKVNNLVKPPVRGGLVSKRLEEQKYEQAKKMEEYYLTHPTSHQNRWSKGITKEEKDGEMKFTLPTWADEAAQLRATGMSGPKIAKQLGVSDAYVYTVLNVISGKGTSRVPWAEEAIKLAGEGKTNGEIAKQMNVTTNRVRDVLAQHQASIQYRKKKESKAVEEVVMSDRKFEETHQTDNGVTRNGVLIRCGADGCHKVERFIRSHGAVHPVQAANYFRAKGWMIGGGPRADRCPDHAYNKKPADPAKLADMSPFHVAKNQEGKTQEKTEEAGVDLPKVPVPDDVQEKNEVAFENAVAREAEEPIRHMVEEHEEAQKEMSKADRRIIFNKIEDVYGDETIGYKGDWSDDRVAEDLGVSVEWVALIRDENFGPARNQALALAETRKAGEEVMAMIEKINATKASIEELSKALKEKLGEYIAIKTDYEVKATAFTELYKSIAK